jgi:predicted porin
MPGNAGFAAGCCSRFALGKITAAALLPVSCWSLAAQESTAVSGNLEVVPAPSLPGAPATNPPDFFSPVSWHYHDWRGFSSLTGQLRYDDNILQTDQNILSDIIGEVIPMVTLEYAPTGQDGTGLLHIDYRPQFVTYFIHSQYDTVDQAADVQLDATRGHWQLKAGYHYALSTDPQIEQTGWARTEIQNADLYAGYELSENTTIDLAPRQEWSSVENGITVWEYGAALEVTRHLSAKLDLKASYYAGNVQVDPGVDAFKQCVLGGFSWEATGRSQLDLDAGFQTMAYQGAGASGGQTAPNFVLNWNYQVTGKTTLQLNASYQTYFSQYVANQVNNTLSFQAKVSHRLTEKIGLELRGGTAYMQQESVVNNTSAGGNLTYWTIGFGAVYHLGRRTDLHLDYDYQNRDGNRFYPPFQRNLIQLSVEYRF